MKRGRRGEKTKALGEKVCSRRRSEDMVLAWKPVKPTGSAPEPKAAN